MGAASFCLAHLFYITTEEMKFMKKIVVLSGACAVIYSAAAIERIAQLWE